jgi:hypothetical protein
MRRFTGYLSRLTVLRTLERVSRFSVHSSGQGFQPRFEIETLAILPSYMLLEITPGGVV